MNEGPSNPAEEPESAESGARPRFISSEEGTETLSSAGQNWISMTTRRHAMLLTEAGLHLIGAATLHVPVGLFYIARDPYAVRLMAWPISEQREWLFARDLLREGMERPTGLGDVEVWPAVHPGENGEAVSVVLAWVKAALDDVLLIIPRTAVQTFLDDTEKLVPLGCESVEVDPASMFPGCE